MGTFLAGFFLIRYLGPANFGVYSTAVALGWFAKAVVDLGLTRYCAREVAADPREGPSTLALALFATAVSVLPEILALIIAALTGHWYAACLFAGLIIGNWEGTASLCSSMLTADLRSRAVLPGSVVGTLGLILVTALVLWLHLSVFVMLVLLSFRPFLVLMLRLWQLRNFWPTRADWHWSEFRRRARLARPFFAYNLTQVGYGWAPVLCFGLVAPAEQVGWFSAAFVISDIFLQWSYAFTSALLPLLTRLYENKRTEQLLDLRQRLLDILMYVSAPIAVLLAIFAPQICHLLGARFLSSAPALRIISYRCVLTVLDSFLGHGFLVAINRVKERQTAQARSLILLIPLSAVFGYFWGPAGAALAVIVADNALILQYLRTFSSFGLNVRWPAMLPTVIAGATMAVACLRLPQTMPWAFKLAPALLIYLFVLILVSRRRLLDAGRTLRECFTGG